METTMDTYDRSWQEHRQHNREGVRSQITLGPRVTIPFYEHDDFRAVPLDAPLDVRMPR